VPHDEDRRLAAAGSAGGGRPFRHRRRRGRHAERERQRHQEPGNAFLPQRLGRPRRLRRIPGAGACGADGLLTIERNRPAYDADASFILNQKDGVFSARPEIRTPGLPADVRRLGDLRLECRVMIVIAKERMSFVAKAALNTLMLGSDWCGKKDMNLAYPAPPGLAAARLGDGARALELTLHDKDFMAPIGDRSWPDDALITLKFAQPGLNYSNCWRKAANCAFSSSTSARSAATSCSSCAVRPPAQAADEVAASTRATSISPPSSCP
jgi:hypothetical protein